MSLIARYLEAQGMPTVIIGSAKDIVERCGVARFLFVDFPLGNPCGKPWDRAMQARIVKQALTLFKDITRPGTTCCSEEQWGTSIWKERYMEVTPANKAELAAKGEVLRIRRAQRTRRSS
ncbi:MAG: hypothetical protein HN856_14245 [Gammaproteobacteria bacterium]|nr:hypothetical protein [Gammaproteobacteria bacterium]MCH1550393.1 hypothetical protein [Pseudomonadales bacterium]